MIRPTARAHRLRAPTAQLSESGRRLSIALVRKSFDEDVMTSYKQLGTALGQMNKLRARG